MPVYAVFGPTASGKTDAAVLLANKLNTVVINCDPAQCYRGLPILTNQPTKEHDSLAEHKMIGVWPLDFSASFPAFCAQAHAEIDQALMQYGSVVLCGGSGLYLHAAITQQNTNQASSIPEKHDPKIRAQIEEFYDNEPSGPEILHQELIKLDPQVGERVHKNDRIRIVRALEVARSGRSISPQGASHWDAPHRHETKLFGLKVERSVIRERIDARTHKMFEQGLLTEIKSVFGDKGENFEQVCSDTAQKLHGLSDCLAVLRGEYTLPQAIEKMAARTRQYAKRQDTWARRWPELISIEATDANFERVTKTILNG